MTTVLKQALRRTILFPMATLTGATLVVLAGVVVHQVPNGMPLRPIASIISFLAGSSIYFFTTTLMVLKDSRLQHTHSLVPTALAYSLRSCLVVGVPYVVLTHLFADQISPYWQAANLEPIWHYHLVSLGAIFCTVTNPTILLAWPLTADTGYPLRKAAKFFSPTNVGFAVRLYVLTIAVTITTTVMVLLPIAVLFVPVLLAHLSTTIYEQQVTVYDDSMLYRNLRTE